MAVCGRFPETSCVRQYIFAHSSTRSSSLRFKNPRLLPSPVLATAGTQVGAGEAPCFCVRVWLKTGRFTDRFARFSDNYPPDLADFGPFSARGVISASGTHIPIRGFGGHL